MKALVLLCIKSNESVYTKYGANRNIAADYNMIHYSVCAHEKLLLLMKALHLIAIIISHSFTT
jgi:hypothetical protein